MIASGYEKAERGWMNIMLPNGMRKFSAHPAIGSVPEVRFRATDTLAMGIRSASALGTPVPYVRARVARS